MSEKDVELSEVQKDDEDTSSASKNSGRARAKSISRTKSSTKLSPSQLAALEEQRIKEAQVKKTPIFLSLCKY